MPREETLKRIEGDIARGNLGKARDRLHGLLAGSPNDLSIRRALGEVYAKLHLPAMAGRYWYLEEDKTEEMQAACEEFEFACGYDSRQILVALKSRGNAQDLEAGFAKHQLLSLQERCRKHYGGYPEFGLKRVHRWVKRRRTYSFNWFGVGCCGTIVVVAVLIVIGLMTVIRWIW